MARFSPQMSSMSVLPTLLAASRMQQGTVLQACQSTTRSSCKAPRAQSPCFSSHVAFAGSCRSPSTPVVRGSRSPRTAEALLQTPRQTHQSSIIETVVGGCVSPHVAANGGSRSPRTAEVLLQTPRQTQQSSNVETVVGGCVSPCVATNGGYRSPRTAEVHLQTPRQTQQPFNIETVAGGCFSPRVAANGGSRTRSAEVPVQTPRQRPSTGFSIEYLNVGMVDCDPSQEPLKSQILDKLGLQQTTIEKLAGSCGGLNEGMWILQELSSSNSLVLKLVRCRREHGMLSEADSFARIHQEHPSIVNDPAVAFPIKVFKCVGHAGKSHDLIVMRKVSGQSLGDVFAQRCRSGGMQDVMRILRHLGSFLARFHKSYRNKQHGDFQPSNVFYDASSGTFAMIDIADLGNTCCAEDDVTHFCRSLKILSTAYGQQFYSDGKRNFEEGYRGLP